MKKDNGITMIALIITIIVMVILAGAAITMVVGDDAVIRKSKTSVAEQNLAQAQEEVKTAWADLEMGFWMDTTDITRSNYFTVTNLEAALAGKGTISELNYVPGGTTTGKYVKDGEEYEFSLDTINHTDVTAGSFGTTSGGYGEGADIVLDTNTGVTEGGEDEIALSGSWTWNDEITFDTDYTAETVYSQPINFTSNGESYRCIKLYSPEGIMMALEYTLADAPYGDGHGIMDFYKVPYGDGVTQTWFVDSTKTMNFGTTPQEVSEEFYNWFIANATKN